MKKYACDSLLGGRLKIRQPTKGYRFSMDAVVIAGQAKIHPGDRVLDLGTGCGVIALMLAHLYPDIFVYGVEIQKSQADIANQNAAENNVSSRIKILHQDLKQLSRHQTSGPVDVVICNPPHIEKFRGRINPNAQLAISRHEIAITMDELLRVAGKMLARSGRLILIYPAERTVDLLERMRKHGIEPKEMTLIYTQAADGARRILITGVKGGKPGIKIPPPLMVNNDGTEAAFEHRLHEGSKGI